ncbi:oligosaccharide flippase family protein [Flavobacterium arsenatis]|nr:oligosaccharide flippase family protein [Flavobacterium arsenatis]
MLKPKNLTDNVKILLVSKFSKDTVWLLMAQIVLFVCGFFLNFIIVYKSGTAGLGLFNKAMAFYTIASIFCALGLNNTLIKKIAEKNKTLNEENTLFTSNIFFTFLVSAFLSTGFIFLNEIATNVLGIKSISQAIVIPFFALPFFNVNKNFMAFYSGKRDQKKVATERILRWLLLLGFVVTTVLSGQSIEVVLYCFLFSEGCLFFFNIYSVRKNIDFNFTRAQVKENFAFGLKTYISEIVSVMNANIDIIIVGIFLPIEELGIYSFIVFFVKTLAVFPGLIMQNINPVVSEFWTKGDVQELKEKIGKIKKVNFYIVGAQFLVLLMAYKIVTSFIKEEFAGTYIYFVICLTGYLFFALVYWSGGMLIMMGKNKENNIRTLMVLILCVVLQLIFTNYFGLLGSCVAMFLCSILNYFLLKIMINKTFKTSII